MAGSIAHDVNNILHVIVGFGSLSIGKMTEGDPMRTNMNHIIAAATRAANLTQSLLYLGRKLVVVPQPVDVHDMLTNVRTFLGMIIGEDVRLVISCTDQTLKVSADCAQLDQVVINLANNARQAMLEGGTLSIDTESVRIDPEFIGRHGFGKPGQYALISVSDDGTGMERDTARRLFEPFFTTRRSLNGTGLGLSIVHRIITEHSGFIAVSSEPDQGTVFRIYLPLIGQLERASLADPDPVEYDEAGCSWVVRAYSEIFNCIHKSEGPQ